AAAIRDERVVAILLGKGVAAIDRNAGGSSEITRRTSPAFHRSGHESSQSPLGANHTPGFVRTDPEYFGSRPVRRDTRQRGRQRVIRVHSDVTGVIHQRLDVARVAAHKLASRAVEAEAVLPATALCAKFQAPRVE